MIKKRIIKTCLTLLFVCYTCITMYAQKNKTSIAPFKITLVDGSTYTYNQLKKDIPTVLIYFSPTCDHCKNFTTELLKHEKELTDKQIVMVTYSPMSELKPFDSTYDLSSKSFIKAGTEGYSFTVQKYYHVQQFPFIALYNKKLELVKILLPTDEPQVLAEQVANF